MVPYWAWWTHFLSFWTTFCPFTPCPLPTQKIKILKKQKLKKTPRDIIILQMCTINDNHMMYSSWDMECDGLNFLLFWTICTFTSLKTQKFKILKKWKNHLEMLSFYTSVPNIMIICYIVPDIWHMMDVIIFHFGLLFACLPPLTIQKLKISKNEKNTWRYYHFTHVYQKLWLDDD